MLSCNTGTEEHNPFSEPQTLFRSAQYTNHWTWRHFTNTVEPGYTDIGLGDISPITSHPYACRL